MNTDDRGRGVEEFGVDLEDGPGLPLIPDDCEEPAEDFVYDETGVFANSRIASTRRLEVSPQGPFVREPITRNCSLATLNGSWNVTIRPRYGFSVGSIRGPMRLEAADGVLRVSGDVYYKPWVIHQPSYGSRRYVLRGDRDVPEDAEDSPVARARVYPYWQRNWYPHYPFDEYTWYFRSAGASYTGGELYFPLVRNLWSKSSQEFISTDIGWMRFTCNRTIVYSRWYPQPTLKMTGEAMIGGKMHSVTATKTSPYYRGSVVEVDVMTNRSWPSSAAGNTFSGSYRGDGIDLAIRTSQTNIPEDNTLTDGELHTLLSTWRDVSDIGATWRVWVLVGSKRSGSNTFGLMFDQTAPHREGCVSYYDATFNNSTKLEPSIRNKKLGEVPDGHLRTLVHEVGHVLNLYHPKHDVHNPGKGTTIMNQTGDVIGFAGVGNLYPDNATFAFNDHNRTSLIHSPDPQIAPGWKPFGWGHGSLSSGLSEPTDVVGLQQAAASDEGLTLDVELASDVVRGEFVTAKVRLTNRSDESAQVSSALNLSEGDLQIDVTTPAGTHLVVRDIAQVCGPARPTNLEPGDSIESTVQLFYNNCGHVFDEPGRYELKARFVTDSDSETTVDSEVALTTVTDPANEADHKLAELSMDPHVGLSFALGDFTNHDDARDKLKEISTDYATTDTGTAAALVLVNSYGRPFRDVRQGEVLRDRDSDEVETAIGHAMDDTGLVRVAEIATTVASTGDADAPVISELKDQMNQGGAASFDGADTVAALKILEDFVG